jgi:hypothetical protein
MRSPLCCEELLLRAMWCFSCGGIGATPDDHTRQCAAKALGLELALQPQAKELILERMRDVAQEQGVPYEPDRAGQSAPIEHGHFSHRRRNHSQPVQQDTRLHLQRAGQWLCSFCARLSRHGLADDARSSWMRIAKFGALHPNASKCQSLCLAPWRPL